MGDGRAAGAGDRRPAALSWLGPCAGTRWQGKMTALADAPDRIPDTPLFDRPRSLRGYRLNKMAMGLGDPANREAFRADENAYLDRFGLSDEEKQAV